MFTVGAFAIITDDNNRVLLCHRRDYDLWNLPGGGVESGETPWAAVTREVFEETSLSIEPTQLLGIYVKPDSDDIVFSFRCEVRSGTIVLTDEADQISWFTLADLPTNISAKQAERIGHAFREQNFPLLHEQHGPSSLSQVRRLK